MGKAFLCCLFVLLTPVDDAWARATPHPDDAWAAANNDYLPRTADEAPRVPPPRHGAGLLEGGTPAGGVAVAPVLPTPSPPDRLYLLMSLRC
jgi:hypothetical protein